MESKVGLLNATIPTDSAYNFLSLRFRERLKTFGDKRVGDSVVSSSPLSELHSLGVSLSLSRSSNSLTAAIGAIRLSVCSCNPDTASLRSMVRSGWRELDS